MQTRFDTNKVILLICFVLILFVSNSAYSIDSNTKNSGYVMLDDVEKVFLQNSGKKLSYEGENFSVIETRDLCELGKLTALHFMKWVENNPDGVIALPTGKTPEYFIKYLTYYKDNWGSDDVVNELQGYNFKSFPDTTNLRLVQLDEFFPIEISRDNSFTHFIKKYYVKILGLKEENILTMEGVITKTLRKHGIDKIFPSRKIDFALINNDEEKTETALLQKQVLLEVNEFCNLYEDTIDKWGGIGFFLGGIGPDGHIAFNLKGSSHDTTTRIINFNYETASSSSNDLGGMEYARDANAITIGLDTISRRNDAEIIIFAAGESKANIIAQSIESSVCEDIPSTAFFNNKQTKFYLTKSSASKLKYRQHIEFIGAAFEDLPFSFLYKTIVDTSLTLNKPIMELAASDFDVIPSAKFLKENYSDKIEIVKEVVYSDLVGKIQKSGSTYKNLSFLHTGPHHDDVILSYYPLVKNMVGCNDNTFCILTSGFRAVTNSFVVKLLHNIKKHINEDSLIFSDSYEKVLEQNSCFLNGCDDDIHETNIVAKKIIDTFEITNVHDLMLKIDGYLKYFDTVYPGKIDVDEIKKMKGVIRETEEERAWILSGVPLSNIYNMRLGFYKGQYFEECPEFERDIQPIIDFINVKSPDVITIAYDPEGTGPDTHYKVLQVFAEAIKHDKNLWDISIWGYRNVWYRFAFDEANIFYFTSQEEMDVSNEMFLKCYSTQRVASFPCYLHDGPFSELSHILQIQQLQQLKVLLGNKFFQNNSDSAIRNAAGVILLKQMKPLDFIQEADDLKKKIILDNLHL
jgi:glucosamine-6-phosphate deaminase